MTGKTLLRLWFLAIFGLGLAVIIATNILSVARAAPGVDDQIKARLQTVIAASGGVIVPTSGKKLRILQPVLQFQMPGCAASWMVLPGHLGHSVEALLRVVIENSAEDYGVYTAYLDETAPSYGFARFQLRSLQIQISQVFGTHAYRFAMTSLTVLVPKSCPDTGLPQWEQFWTTEAAL